MPIHVQFCHVKKERGLSPCRVERKTVHSLISLSEINPLNGDLSENSENSRRRGYTRQFSVPDFSKVQSLFPSEHARCCNSTDDVNPGQPDRLGSLTNPPIVVTFHSGATVRSSKSTSCYPPCVTASDNLANGHTLPTDAPSDNSPVNTELYSVATSLSEKVAVSNSPYHGIYCQALQSVELNQVDPKAESPPNGWFERLASSSSSSLSTCSLSPSPVRSQVASPFAANTLKPGIGVESKVMKTDFSGPSLHAIPGSILGSRTNPFDYDLTTPSIPADRNCDSKCMRYSVSSPVHSCRPDVDAYPTHLNPFDSFDSDDASNDQNIKNPALQSRDNTVTNTIRSMLKNKHPSVPTTLTSANVSTYDHTSLEDIIPCGYIDSRRYRTHKKPAPLPPTMFANFDDRNGPISKENASAPDGIPHLSLNFEPICRLPSHRSSSACRSSQVDSAFKRQENLETKSMIIKRPAPSLPVYDKRTIRAHPSETFMEYSELHKMLYITNKRIIELEAEGRKLQQAIKQANQRKADVKELLEKWMKIVELRDSLSIKHTRLLERVRRQELAERHANLEHEYRLLWAKQNALKTPEEHEREQLLLDELLQTVNERAELAELCCGDETERSTESPSTVTGKHVRKFVCWSTLLRKHKTNKSTNKTPR